jgi:ABC-type sugar transport system ATPase subunit
MATVRLEHVSKVYPDGYRAVRDLDLDIADGELHVLLGPSGCGKSTVLRMVAGLEDVTSGDILVDGRRINEMSPNERDIAMSFQTHALYPHMSVRANLGFPLKVSGCPPDEIDARVDEIARLLHVDDLLDESPRRLSGGQQQRVSLGRSIVRSPRLFLMDEPLSNLDSRLRIESRAEIMRLQRHLRTTTIFVTHDQVEAMAMADRVTLMRDGDAIQTGPPAEVYANPVDLFVAQFMGSIAANADAGGTPLDGMRLGVGIRPESLHRDDAGSLVSSVEFTEPLGSNQLVHATIDAPSVSFTPAGVEVAEKHRTSITAFVDIQERVSLWEPFTLRMDRDAIHLFDLETGRSLRAPS